jgi:predicted DNA-binding transcriptional regulator AlpA
MSEGYVDLARLSDYSGLSVRTLQRHLKDPNHPLPCHRVGRRLLFDKREFDAWVRRLPEEQVPSGELSVAESVARALGKGR